MRLPLLLLLSALTASLCAAREAALYVGTFTKVDGRITGSKGIYRLALDLDTGRLGAPEVAAAGDNPTFLAFAPGGRQLYATSEVPATDGRPGGAVYAFALAGDGGLTLLNRASSGGPGPCHIGLDPSGRMLMAANYDNGTIAALPVRGDGSLGEPAMVIQHQGRSVNPGRQTHAYAHSVYFSRDGRFVFSDDLGVDKIYSYRIDPAQATLTDNDPAFTAIEPGSGPRHLAFHPDGHHAYGINEMASTVTVFEFDAARGALTPTQTISALPAGFKGTSTGAEIFVHPSGRYVYASNRGDDSLAVFRVESGTGRLTFVEAVSTQGKTPRSFALDPSGAWLVAANQNSDSLVAYRIDPATGRLTETGSRVSIPAPVCVLFAR
mgnify:CR=1 FL=1